MATEYSCHNCGRELGEDHQVAMQWMNHQGQTGKDDELAEMPICEVCQYRNYPVLRIERVMPEIARQALRAFIELNPHWNGAHWADTLDTLMDSDSHLEITEDENLPNDEYSSLIAVTLFYAHRSTPDKDEVQLLVARIEEANQ